MLKIIFELFRSGKYREYVDAQKAREEPFEMENESEYLKLMTMDGMPYKPNPWSKREIAVFSDKGVWCLAEVDQGRFGGINKELLRFVDYNSITTLQYNLTRCSRYSVKKNLYSSVWLGYTYIDERFTELQRNTLVLRVGRTTGAARRFAHAIAKRCDGVKVKRTSLF